jgi:hypothetical protein
MNKELPGNITITTKEIAYTVTVENRTFKPIDELQVKYMTFYLDPNPEALTSLWRSLSLNTRHSRAGQSATGDRRSRHFNQRR